jgi:multidrug resistance efflux pump
LEESVAKPEEPDLSADADKRVARLEEKIEALSATLKRYQDLGEGTKAELERRAKELERQSQSPDIAGVSDAMLQEVRTDIKALREDVAGLKDGKQKPEKNWSIF